ncbi:MAG: hypothetical protein HY939_05670 [Gammaproteobacteria bacterium]|nr:hypothetical protein [Gammaproteobacteria bacterium]
MKYLAFAVISKPQTKLVYDLSKFIQAAGCNILEMRWVTLGKEGVGSYLLSGNWNAIAKLEVGFPHFERKHEITIIPRRVELTEPHADRLPYTVYVTSQDRAGIFEDVMGFLTSEDAEIIEVNAYTYVGRFTKAPMASLTIALSLPASLLISDFRERFIVFCDELNLDATLEPDKG